MALLDRDFGIDTGGGQPLSGSESLVAGEVFAERLLDLSGRKCWPSMRFVQYEFMTRNRVRSSGATGWPVSRVAACERSCALASNGSCCLADRNNGSK